MLGNVSCTPGSSGVIRLSKVLKLTLNDCTARGDRTRDHEPSTACSRFCDSCRCEAVPMARSTVLAFVAASALPLALACQSDADGEDEATTTEEQLPGGGGSSAGRTPAAPGGGANQAPAMQDPPAVAVPAPPPAPGARVRIAFAPSDAVLLLS